MQQRQLRLGDILDDYCPRERRLTNHAVVAMIGNDVKQTRCTTCDAEHEYKHAKVPRQRRKSETPAALYSQVLANAPKRVTHDASSNDVVFEPPEDPQPEATEADAIDVDRESIETSSADEDIAASGESVDATADAIPPAEAESGEAGRDEGPVHRPLIRASLPRPEGQPPTTRPIPEFTIRQPGGRPGRFRPRHQRGQGHQFQGNRSNGNMGGGPPRGGMRQGAGRPQQGGMSSRVARRHGPGRKRSK
jgi:hypothetical protein